MSTSLLVRMLLLALMLWGSLTAVDHGMDPTLCAMAYWWMAHAIDRAWNDSEVSAKERAEARRRMRT